MKLLRLSGHSGAGKSRLLAALKKTGLEFKKVILYTSRPPRKGEIDGFDYYFLNKEEIEQLPKNRFIRGYVREMLQAVDLVQLIKDIDTSLLVIIEIYSAFWADVRDALLKHFGNNLKIASVFLTAIDPSRLKNKSLHDSSIIIRTEVMKILNWRSKNDKDTIIIRSESAVNEILTALEMSNKYDKIIFSSPEGPDGEDEWTQKDHPIGQAKRTLDEFVNFIQNL